MAIGRTQIRLGAITGSLDASGAKIAAGALDVDSLQGSLDALAAAMQRQIGAVPADSWYALDKDVISISAAAVVSGSLILKNGSAASKLKIDNTGIMSGSGIRLGTFGATDATIFSEVNADLSIGPGPETAWTNRHIILDGGTAGTTGGVRAVVQASGGAFKVNSSAAPTAAAGVFSVTDAGAVSGSKYEAGGVIVGDSWATVRGAYLEDAGGHRRITFGNGDAVRIKNDAGAADVVAVSDTVVTVTGDITGSKGLRLTGAVGDRVLHVDAGNAQFDNNVDVAGNVVITGNLDVNGTTTTIDTDNLTVQDSVIGMGISGSGIPGPAGDRALYMCIRSENDPAFVWSEANSTFALVRTATSLSASLGTIALTSDADLRVGDLSVRGGNLILTNADTAFDLRENRTKALVYKDGAAELAHWNTEGTADDGLHFHDNVVLSFGNGPTGDFTDIDAGIRYQSGATADVGADTLVISGSTNTDIIIGVDAGDDVRLKVAGTEVLKAAGTEVKIMQKLVGPTSATLHASSSAGQQVKLSATGGEIRFHDKGVLDNGWTQQYVTLSANKTEWANYKTKFGEVSLMNAIEQAANLGSTAAKYQFGLTTNVNAGTALSTGTGASTINLNALTPLQRSLTDVYVNGQLMLSGTEANRSAGTVDYTLVDSAPASSDFKFSFNILADDVVSITVK